MTHAGGRQTKTIHGSRTAKSRSMNKCRGEDFAGSVQTESRPAHLNLGLDLETSRSLPPCSENSWGVTFSKCSGGPCLAPAYMHAPRELTGRILDTGTIQLNIIYAPALYRAPALDRAPLLVSQKFRTVSWSQTTVGVSFRGM